MIKLVWIQKKKVLFDSLILITRREQTRKRSHLADIHIKDQLTDAHYSCLTILYGVFFADDLPVCVSIVFSRYTQKITQIDLLNSTVAFLLAIL